MAVSARGGTQPRLDSQAWAKEGAALTVAIQSDRFRSNVESLVADWQVKPQIVELDVSNDQSIARAVQDVGVQHGGKLNMVLHSIAYASASAMKQPLLDTSRADFQQAMDISAYSLLAMTRACAPLMDTAGGGCVLSLSYLGAERVVPSYKVMGPAKAALEALSRGLAVELGARNIRVNTISAGPMDTLAARGIPGFTTLKEAAGQRAPLGRLARPQDVGAMAAFLASDAAASITGTTMYVDAGLSALA